MDFFSSDHHFGHNNIIGYCNRPYTDVNHMNEDMVARWNEVVQPTDLVWYLGDFSLSIEAAEKYLPRLNGRKKLIVGNHDKCFSNRKFNKTFYELGFESIDHQVIIDINGQPVKLCHFPYHEPEHVNLEYKVRFLDFRPTPTTPWLLHGHVHQAWHHRGPQINVGVDVWDFRPVSTEQIIELMNKITSEPPAPTSP